MTTYIIAISAMIQLYTENNKNYISDSCRHCVGSSRNSDAMTLKHLTSVDSSNSEGLSTPMFPVANYLDNEDMQ